MKKEISIIVPLYNEKENLSPLIQHLYEVMEKFGRSYECLFIDDGSTDGSDELLRELSKQYPAIRVVTFRRNFGQTAALSAGFDYAEGQIIVTLDADLQNDPSDIPMMIEKLEEGYDLVNGWRKERQDSWIRILPSRMANGVISYVTGIHLHDYGCTMKAYRKEVVHELRLYGEMHRFIPALASWRGVKFTEIPVKHHPRKFGQSKYDLSRTLRVILDLITVKFFLSYSTSPIHIFGKIGILSSLFGGVTFIIAVILKFAQARTLTGNPLFYLFIFMEIVGVQMILIGLLGEINVRIYHESQQKKIYVVKDDSKLLAHEV